MHKRIFYNVFNPNAAEPTKAAARALFEPTFDYLAKRLGQRRHLVGNSFTVADAYLVTMLNWFVFLKVDLAKWPTLAAYHQKHLKRPSVVQAMGVEMAERQRRAAAYQRSRTASRKLAVQGLTIFLFSTANRSFGAFSRASGP